VKKSEVVDFEGMNHNCIT